MNLIQLLVTNKARFFVTYCISYNFICIIIIIIIIIIKLLLLLFISMISLPCEQHLHQRDSIQHLKESASKP